MLYGFICTLPSGSVDVSTLPRLSIATIALDIKVLTVCKCYGDQKNEHSPFNNSQSNQSGKIISQKKNDTVAARYIYVPKQLTHINKVTHNRKIS